MVQEPSKAKRVALWAVVLLTGVFMLNSGVQKLFGNLDEMLASLGVPLWAIPVIGVIEVAGAVLYLVSRTRFYGGVLLGGVLAGAVLTHFANADFVGWVFAAVPLVLIAPIAWAYRPYNVRQIALFAAARPRDS